MEPILGIGRHAGMFKEPAECATVEGCKRRCHEPALVLQAELLLHLSLLHLSLLHLSLLHLSLL